MALEVTQVTSKFKEKYNTKMDIVDDEFLKEKIKNEKYVKDDQHSCVDNKIILYL